MNTLRTAQSRRLRISSAKMAGLAAVACAGLAPIAGAQSVYAWTPHDNSADAWEWTSTKKPPFVSGAWSNTGASSKAVEFVVAATNPLTISGAVDVNQLRFRTTGYSLQGGTSGSLRFVGSAPSIAVDAGVATTFDVPISVGTAGGPLILDVGTSAQSGNGSFIFGRSNLFADNVQIDLRGGGVMNLGGYSDTVGSFTLTNGTVQNGTLTAGSYVLRNGSVNATLGGGAISVTGAVALGGNGHFNGASSLTVNGGALSLGNNSETVSAFTLASGSLADGTLTSANAFDVESGSISANLAGDGYLWKSGDGSVSLSGNNTYRGSTNVGAGSLLLGGGSLSSGVVNVSAGAFFGGSGNASASRINLNGRISPAGALSTGDQYWYPGSGYDWNPGDLLQINGLLSVEGRAALRIFDLDVSTLTQAPSYSWTIATATGGFARTSSIVIDSSRVVFGSNSGAFSLGGTATRLDLIFTPVPEPEDYAIILGMVTFGLVGYRRWRRTHQFA